MVLRAVLGSTVLVFSLSFTGCGGDPPEKEIQQAQGAIDSARAAGADLYGADELAAASAALQSANAAVEQRDYRLALNHALDSRERAENAIRQAAEGKAAARAKADAAVAEARLAIDSALARVKLAESAKVAPRATADARAAAAQAELQLQEARSAIGRGEYGKAAEQAAAITGQAKAAEAGLSAALPPSMRRRR